VRKIEVFIPDSPVEEILDKPQLAKRLQVSERMLELMEQRGELPVIRFGIGGKVVRYRWSDVLESLQAQTQRHLTTSDAS
jgi:predicted DNA-binding transcriptional regulator AlpA